VPAWLFIRVGDQLDGVPIVGRGNGTSELWNGELLGRCPASVVSTSGIMH